MNQQEITWLNLVHRLDQVVRGHAFEQSGGDHVGLHDLGNISDEISWCGAVFSIGSDRIGGDDSITDVDDGHVVTDRRHRSAHLAAGDVRQLPRVGPGAEIDVDVVHPDGIGLDEHFAGAGGGNRFLDVAQDLGTACLGDFDSVHVTIIPVVRSQ